MNYQIRKKVQNNQYHTFNNQKRISHKGITLIALIITIVVLMILATISIQAISGEGIFGKAREAAFKAEMAQLQEDLGLFVTEKQLANRGEFDVTTLNASINGAYYNTTSGVEVQEGTIETILPSISEKRSKQIEIIKGELLFASQDDNEKKWAQELGIGINPWNIVDGVLMSSDTNLKLLSEDGVLALPTSITKVADGAFANVKGIKKVIIPGNVKEIGANAFAYNSTLEEVIIQDGVEKIGSTAFYDCRRLTKVEMTDSVLSIGNAAFYYNFSLKSIVLSNNVTELTGWLFCNCKVLESITMPANLKSIGVSTFQECVALQSVTIPQNVTSIDSSAFLRCSSLKRLEVDSNNHNFVSVDGILMNKNKTNMKWVSPASGAIENGTFTIPDGITTVGGGLIGGYENIKRVVIPSSVTKIDFTFFTTYITSVQMDDNKIYQSDGNAIYSKDETILYKYIAKTPSVTLKEGLLTIEASAFSCIAGTLTDISLPNSLETIKSQAFAGCSQLKSLFLKANVNSLDPIFIYGLDIDVSIDER